MKARGDVAAHYTLDTNWRSSPGMVAASIGCSASAITLHVPRDPVPAGEGGGEEQGAALTVDAADVPAMNVWLMPGDTVGSGDYQTLYGELCATQIRATG